MMAGGKLEIIIPMRWALRVSRGNIVKANASSQMMLAMLASTNNTDVTEIWVIWPLIVWHRARPAVNFLLYSFELEWCLCRRWSRTCGERLLENQCSCSQESLSSTLNTADTIRASHVVHPPAGCLLPGTYQLDVLHHTVCGWISHTRIKSTFKKSPNHHPTLCAAALSFHQACTPTAVTLRLAPAITANKHYLIEGSFRVLEAAENRDCGRNKIDKWQNDSDYVKNDLQIQDRSKKKKQNKLGRFKKLDSFFYF